MDEFDEFSEHRDTRMPGQRLGEWVREHRIVILYGVLLTAVMFSRGLWGLDERRIAEQTRGLLASGKWFPYESGITSQDGASVLYLWLTKVSAWLAGLMGGAPAPDFQVWPFRLPSVIGSIMFLHCYRRWASRFLQSDVASIAMMILCATPLWFWQSQAIQVDLLYSAMLGWSWLCWLAGYRLLRRQADGSENEHRRWFRWSYSWLGLACLVRGPQALLLTGLLLFIFLIWQEDLKAVKETFMNWGLLVLMALLIAGYVSGLVPGLHPLLLGFSRVQPIWIWAEYLGRDLFPWLLLLPALLVFLRGSGAHKAPIARFLLLAFLVPFSTCLWGDGIRGTDPLAAYPFLALLLAGLLQPVYVEGVSLARIRRIGSIMAAALWLAAFSFFTVSVLRLGWGELQGVVTPMLGAMRLATLVLVLGALSVSVRCASGEGEFLVRETTATVCVVFFILGTWGFRSLDSRKRNESLAKASNRLQILE
jgi:hypothetical protein